MLFHPNRKAVNYLNLLINNINIENVAELIFLGIQLSQNLKWKAHQNIVHEFPKHSLRYKLIFTLNNTSTTIIEKASSQSLKLFNI